ncbi:MAG: metalloregulator ArsR/SmtB family transcription factor [Candidatus Marinimicrobia bacterium]|nr:metalloregulator ArsR/SmtB family transcription factor [Candidatus Neomarinimicrobiota bacterium]
MDSAAGLHANLCQAIADPTRIELLYALDKKPCHVNELAEQLALPQATTSRHLKILREQGIVTTLREGPFVIYTLRYQRIIQALDIMRSIKLDIIQNEHDLINERSE